MGVSNPIAIGTSAGTAAAGDDPQPRKGRVQWNVDHNNLLLANYDPLLASAGIRVTGGFIYAMRVYVPTTVTVASIRMYVNLAGSTLTASQNFAGIYDSGGTLIAKTADQSGVWNSASLKTMALTAEAGQSLTIAGGASTWVYAAVVSNGTTPPGFAHAPVVPDTLIETGLSASDGYRCAYTSVGSRTSLVTPLPALATASQQSVPWVGFV